MKRWMPRKMICWLAASLMLAGVLGVSSPAFAKKAKKAKAQKILINLTKYADDYHAAFMAVKLGKALIKSGAKVTIFVNLEGARLSDKRLPLKVFWGPSTTPLSKVLRAYFKVGGKLLVCPHCAKAAGIKPGDLRKGAKIGTMKDITSAMLSADKILSY